MDGLSYTTVIEPAEPLASRRWLGFGSLGCTARPLIYDTHKNTMRLWSEVCVRCGASQRPDGIIGRLSGLRHRWHRRRQSDYFTDIGGAGSATPASHSIARRHRTRRQRGHYFAANRTRDEASRPERRR